MKFKSILIKTKAKTSNYISHWKTLFQKRNCEKIAIPQKKDNLKKKKQKATKKQIKKTIQHSSSNCCN